jgi:hypothetical protein
MATVAGLGTGISTTLGRTRFPLGEIMMTGKVKAMIREPQQALHVVDYYLWRAMNESMSFAPAASYYSIQCREAWMDQREMERDRRESW